MNNKSYEKEERKQLVNEFVFKYYTRILVIYVYIKIEKKEDIRCNDDRENELPRK
jgi:hypothetical protein